VSLRSRLERIERALAAVAGVGDLTGLVVVYVGAYLPHGADAAGLDHVVVRIIDRAVLTPPPALTEHEVVLFRRA
jgi:hypothetical protein